MRSSTVSKERWASWRAASLYIPLCDFTVDLQNERADTAKGTVSSSTELITDDNFIIIGASELFLLRSGSFFKSGGFRLAFTKKCGRRKESVSAACVAVQRDG